MPETTTPTPAPAIAPIVPTPPTPPTFASLAALFYQFGADELGQAINTLQPIETNVVNGDGSAASLASAWLQLQAAFIGNITAFQKIGVVDLSKALMSDLQQLQTYVAALAAAKANPAPAPAPESAPDAAPTNAA